MAVDVGSVELEVTPGTRNFARNLDRDISRQNARFSGIGKKLGIAIAAGTVAAGAVLGKALFDSIGAASDLSETINKSNVIFGANAKVVDKWSKGAARNLGLSRAAALAAASGFGDMFQQLGFAGEASAEMSKQVVQMSADLGSFNNLPTAEVADMIAAAFRGEYDSLQRLIPNINAARVEQEALTLSGKKATKELTAQEKAAATLAIIQRDGARATGDFARTSDGLANSSKILSAQWQDMSARIGGALIPVAATFVAFLNDNMQPAFDGMSAWWTEHGPTILSTGKAVFGGLADGMGLVVRHADILIPAAAGVLAGFLAFKAISTVKAWVDAAVGAFNLGRGAVENFRLQLHLAHQQGLTTGQALRSVLGGHLLGLAGLITGTVIAAFVAWRQAKERARQRMEELTEAIKQDTGALGENTRALTFNRLQKEGLADIARKLGISLDDLVSAALGDVEAQRRVAEATSRARQEMQEAARGAGRMGEEQIKASNDVKKLEKAVGDMAAETQVANRRAADYLVTVGDAKPHVDRAVSALGHLSQELRNQSARFMAAGGPVGTAFAQGVASGLVNQASLAYINSAASRLVGYTVSAAKRFGEIRSPSALTEREVGMPLAEGVAIGISGGQFTINNAMSETLGKLMSNPGVAQVVAEARRLGVTVADELAEAISKGKVRVADAMAVLAQEAGRQAAEAAEKAAQAIVDGFNAILGGFRGASGRFSAARALRDARLEFEDAQARKQTIGGDLSRAERELAKARREAAAVTLEEERDVIQAQKRVREAESKLAEMREAGEATADDLRLAEIEVSIAQRDLQSVQEAVVGSTDAVRQAEEELRRLREEEEALDRRLIDAKDRLTEAQLHAIEAQKAFEQSTAALIAQGAEGEAEFRRLAEAIGLTSEEIDRLIRIAHSIPTPAGQSAPVLRTLTPEEQRRAVGLRSRIANPNTDPVLREEYKRRLRELEGRATGGPVVAGRAYLVGEEGPEPWVPRMPGTVLPHDFLADREPPDVRVFIGDKELRDIVRVEVDGKMVPRRAQRAA